MSATGRTILRVGLTGNIGAGKSLVAAVLADHGCLVVDADRLGHELLASDPETRTLIAAELGDAVLGADGRPDRRAIAAVVFADEARRRALNRVMHPRIRAREEERVAAWASAAGAGIAVTEAALLVEAGGAERYDRLVVVTAPEAVRIDRLVHRGMERVAAERRCAAQAPEADKVAAADYLIDNGGEREATRRQASRLHRALLEDLAALRGGVRLARLSTARRFDRDGAQRS